MSEVIRLADVTRDYQLGTQEVRALRGIDLSIERGEFIALVGPSGSGKSSLLNLLGGLDRPTSGELWLDGVALHTAREAELTAHRRWRVGFIFQKFNLLPRLTALENVALPLMLAGVDREQRESRARALLARVGLGERLDHRPNELSGGEQQRVAIARALVNEPLLILADEPTGNLDSATGDEVMALLRELNEERGVTLILVTHDLEVASYARRVVRLRDGHVEHDDGSPATNGAATDDGPQALGIGRLALQDMLRTAFDNLWRRPVRNILTTMGVLIGIITLVAMVSFGVGVQTEIRRNFESIGLENIFVTPLYDESFDEFDPFAPPAPQRPITPALVDEVLALPQVVTATPRLRLPSGMDTRLALGDAGARVRISYGFPEGSFGPPGSSELLAGTELGPGVDVSGTVLVEAVADQLLEGSSGSYDDLIGQTVTMTVTLPRGETEDFVMPIVGVRSGFSSSLIDVGIADKIEIKSWWYGQPDIIETEGFDEVIVQAQDLDSVESVVTFLEDREVSAQSLEAILGLANQVFAILQALLSSVGALALLVAALGVANTMMMAIYERTREIGVLKALGASPGEVRWLFTAEAALLGLLGGVFGLIIGTLLGKLIDWIAHQYLISEGVTGIGPLSIVPWWLAIGALIFAALIGIVAGVYPAARAARLDPVVALRQE